MFKFNNEVLLKAGLSRADIAALLFIRRQVGSSDQTMSLDDLRMLTEASSFQRSEFQNLKSALDEAMARIELLESGFNLVDSLRIRLSELEHLEKRVSSIDGLKSKIDEIEARLL